jgi:hypothetical protein
VQVLRNLLIGIFCWILKCPKNGKATTEKGKRDKTKIRFLLKSELFKLIVKLNSNKCNKCFYNYVSLPFTNNQPK